MSGAFSGAIGAGWELHEKLILAAVAKHEQNLNPRSNDFEPSTFAIKLCSPVPPNRTCTGFICPQPFITLSNASTVIIQAVW